MRWRMSRRSCPRLHDQTRQSGKIYCIIVFHEEFRFSAAGMQLLFRICTSLKKYIS
ncbi:hypothetical protein Mapa_006350 [Marchantia paleacea]|nr:hypothetical protein Mapa_006350 [Marchantia paleacea]